MADEEQVQETTEETPEVEEETTQATEGESSESESSDDGKDYRKIAEDQRRRAEKAENELKKFRKKPADPEAPSTDQSRLDRIELNSLGIKSRDEQDFVIGAAKRMGVSLSEAADDDIVSARLEKMRDTRKTKDATPAPGRGTGASGSNITKLAEKALATGELPSDAETRAKVRAEMKRLTQK